MSKQSLSQLDTRLKELAINDLLAMNQISEKNQLQQKSRAYNLAYLAVTGFMLVPLITNFPGASYAEYIQLALSLMIFIVSIVALIRGGTQSLLATAFAAALIGIYHLILIHIFKGSINVLSLIMGAWNIFFALQYIQQANHYKLLDEREANLSQNLITLYQDMMATLSQTKPDLSNNLIDLNHLTQKITVWLRPSIIVLYLHREKRLFFDTSQSFEMTISGKDKGSDKVNVRARIIDKLRYCSVSRHGWLRYIRYAR